MEAKTIFCGFLFVFLLASAGLGAQLSSVFAQEQPKYGGTLTYAQSALTHGNPAVTVHLYMFAGTLVYNALVHVDMDFKPQPELAESWEISADFKKYTFHLVKNAFWHDGEPFTSADVKFTIEEVLLPYNPLGNAVYAGIESIETPDDHTVIVNMKEAYPDFLFHLTKFSGCILPKHLYEGTDILKNPYNLKPVGTGPFMVEEFVAEDHAILVRNPNYWRNDGLPYLDQVVVKVIKTIPSQIVALEAGDIDLVPALVPTYEAARLKGEGFDVQGKPGLAGAIDFVFFNLERPPLDELNVRKAIAHALDTDYLVDTITQGMFKSATTAAGSSLDVYDPNIKPYEFDLELANRLLDDAGYPKKADGFRFKTTITPHPIFYEIPKIAEAMREQLKKIGIDLEVVKLDVAAYNDLVAGKYDYDIGIEAKATGAVYAQNMARYLHTRQIGAHQGNMMSYSDARMDQLLDDLAKELNPERKKQLASEIQQKIRDEVMMIPVEERTFIDAWNPDFKGYPMGIDLTPRDGIDTVWWTKATGGPPTTATMAVDTWIIALVGIAVLAILVAAVLLVRSRRRKK